MPALFATFLLLSLALAGALAFSSPGTRGWLKWVLLLSLLVAWVALGFAVKDIVLRTSATLITPRGVHQPQLVEQAQCYIWRFVVSSDDGFGSLECQMEDEKDSSSDFR